MWQAQPKQKNMQDVGETESIISKKATKTNNLEHSLAFWGRDLWEGKTKGETWDFAWARGYEQGRFQGEEEEMERRMVEFWGSLFSPIALLCFLCALVVHLFWFCCLHFLNLLCFYLYVCCSISIVLFFMLFHFFKFKFSAVQVDIT